MTAKNKDLIENLALFNESKSLRRAGFLQHEDVVRIKSDLPLPRTSSNFLFRLGFFFLGCTLYSSILGSISLFFLDTGLDYPYVMLVFSMLGLLIAELLSHKDFHNFGLDDAFILSFQLMFCAAIGVLTESPTLVFVLLSVLGLASCYRYFSTGSMLFALIGISSFLGSVVTVHKVVDALFLPFIMLATAGLMYYGYQRFKEHALVRPYQNSLRVVKFFSIILAYLSVNYAVVREMSEDLLGIEVTPGNDIPLAWLFYFLTVAVPAFYITYSLRKRDRVFLLVGIGSFAASIITIRMYHALLPLESALVLGGLALIVASLYAMKKWKTNETGITFLADRFRTSKALSYAQAAIGASQTAANGDASNAPMPFGGGDFSGGGTSGNY